MFYKKGVPREFHKNHRKVTVPVSDLLWHRYFSVNFAKLLRTTSPVATSFRSCQT